jgi:hypothetical protein
MEPLQNLSLHMHTNNAKPYTSTKGCIITPGIEHNYPQNLHIEHEEIFFS